MMQLALKIMRLKEPAVPLTWDRCRPGAHLIESEVAYPVGRDVESGNTLIRHEAWRTSFPAAGLWAK